ncbi:MAG: flippase-like domain-containing protein [Elusimicrobiales bacterium]|nr:flippase-like domain-containing protein [Elusimicrobiales bacterium]
MLISSIGILISLILIFFTFSNIKIDIFFSYLSKINILYIPFFIISTFFELLFRTMKWYFILIPITKIPIMKLFKFEVIALGINNILPFRMGELAKMILVSKNYNLSKTTALATVFIERLLDTIFLFIIFIWYSIIGNINIPFITKETGVFIIIITTFTIYFLFVYSEKIFKTKIFRKIEYKHPKIHSIILKIKNGGICFKSTKITILIIISGLIQWNFDVLNNYIIAKSLSIQNIDLPKAAITVVAGSLSASIPSMPGYFGNYEYAISRICMLWNINKELATLFPTLIHILTYLIITTTSLIFIYTEGVNMKKLINTKKEN